jgi:hypothetical protein
MSVNLRWLHRWIYWWKVERRADYLVRSYDSLRLR